MLKIVTISFAIWSIFDPYYASIFYIIVLFVFEFWIILNQYIVKLAPDHTKFSYDEILVIKKFSLFIRYPFASRSFSKTLSLNNILTFLWVPWLFYNKIWLQPIILVINYPIVAFLASKLNPAFFLNEFVKDGHTEFLSEKKALESIVTKINKKYQENMEKYWEENQTSPLK